MSKLIASNIAEEIFVELCELIVQRLNERGTEIVRRDEEFTLQIQLPVTFKVLDIFELILYKRVHLL